MAKKPPGVRIARRRACMTFYFQRRIPPAIASLYPEHASGFFRVKLPSSQADAYRAATSLWAQLDEEFERAAKSGSRAAPAVSPKVLAKLSQAALSRSLQADEETRASGGLTEEWAFEHHVALTEDIEAQARAALARGVVGEGLAIAVEEWLRSEDIALPPDSPERLAAAREFARRFLEGVRVRKARDEGEDVPTPPMPAADGHGVRMAGKYTLDDLIDHWREHGGEKRPKSIAEAESAAKRFAKVNPGLALGEIQKRHMIAFRDARLKEGKTPSTVSKDISLLRAAFEVAIADEKFGLTLNPASKIRIPNAGRQARGHFSAADIRAIFASDVFADGHRPQAGKGDTAYWLPLLALHTGARLAELAQLRVADIKEEDGVTFVHFQHDPATGRMLKTGATGNKRVPVHSNLIRLGFLERVERLRTAGEAYLFPLLWDGSTKKPADKFGDWFRRHLDGIGMTEKGRGMHTFRHTFVFLARQAGIPEDQRKALVGHAASDVQARYGSLEGYPVRPLKEAIERIGIDLPI